MRICDRCNSRDRTSKTFISVEGKIVDRKDLCNTCLDDLEYFMSYNPRSKKHTGLMGFIAKLLGV